MALIPADLADQLATDVVGPTSAQAFSQLGAAIASYIITNTVVNFAWVGALAAPPNTPDPAVVATGEFVSMSFSLSPSNVPNQAGALSALATQLMAGMATATYNITQSGFTTSAALISTALPLVLTVTGPTRELALLQMATQIITWVKTHVPTAPCSGSHAPYVGSGTATTIL